MRDLIGESEANVARERLRVAAEGWGARLLDLQGADGHWGGAAFVPRAWISTKDTLQLLRDLGVDPTSDRVRRAIGQVRDRCTWGEEFGNSPFFEGEVEPCINGRVLAIGAYFGEARDRLVDRLLQEQLSDGGWNCYAPPSQRSSFHSTICVLEGLLEYETATGPRPDITAARLRGQEYLLERRLFRSRSTGQIIKPVVDRDFVPHALALRHPVGPGLPAAGRRRTRRAHGRGDRSGAEEARRARALAAREPASGSGSLRDGRRRRRAEPLEHASSASRAALGECAFRLQTLALGFRLILSGEADLRQAITMLAGVRGAPPHRGEGGAPLRGWRRRAPDENRTIRDGPEKDTAEALEKNGAPGGIESRPTA